jgi:hypothetical protein
LHGPLPGKQESGASSGHPHGVPPAPALQLAVKSSRDARVGQPFHLATERGDPHKPEASPEVALTSTSVPRPRRGGRIKRLQESASVQQGTRSRRHPSMELTAPVAPQTGLQGHKAQVKCAKRVISMNSERHCLNQVRTQGTSSIEVQAAQPQQDCSSSLKSCSIDVGKADVFQTECAKSIDEGTLGRGLEVGEGLRGHLIASLVAESRSACRLPFLTGCAPVCYGMPTVFARHHIGEPHPD